MGDESRDQEIRAVRVMGLRVDVGTMRDMMVRLVDAAAGDERLSVTYLNPDCVNRVFADRGLKDVYENFDLVLVDGTGILWGARREGVDIPERCAATDMFPEILKMSVERGLRVYFLGAKPGVVDKMSSLLEAEHPGLEIAGARHGYFEDDETPEIVESINAARPDAIFIGMGAPRQEKWLLENRSGIEASLCWCVGGLFDFYSGNIPRAPRWMSRAGIEWMYRLYREPGRMWKRYLIGNLLFVSRVVAGRKA